VAFRDLPEFIKHLEKQGELRRIGAQVDPHLEITEIADRVMKSPGGGPALLFENVKGSSMPLAINLFGSARRMAWALEVQHLDELSDKIRTLLDVAKGPPSGWIDRFRLLGNLAQVARTKPKLVKNPPCQEVGDPRRGEPLDLLPSSPAGPRTPVPTSRSRWWGPRTRWTAAATSACTSLQKFDGRTTGMHCRSTRWARTTSAKARRVGGGWRSPWRWVAIPPRSGPAPPRCRPAWTS